MLAAFEGADASRAYWRRVALLARARWRTYLVFCGAMVGFNMFRVSAIFPLDTQPLWLTHSGISLEYWVGWGPMLFAAIVLSEALELRGIRHAIVSFAGLAIAIALAVAALKWWNGGVLNRPIVEANYIVSDGAFVGRMFWTNLAGGMLLVTYFAFKEREAASERLAREVELERARAQRVTMAARLKVMQARVEPELLFGVLAEVRTIYERDIESADALLDDLITYLRAALPQMRSDASTLDREIGLAAAYLKLLPALRHGEVEIDIPARAEGMTPPFPPMVLLPLVQAAAESFIARVTIVVHQATDGADARVHVDVDPKVQPPAWSEERLAPLRTTLRQYFGEQHARLTIEGSRATVQWTDVDAGGARPGWAVNPFRSFSPV